MYSFQFAERGYKDLKKITPKIRKRIIDKLTFFSKQSAPLHFSEVLINSEIGQYRFRVGDYRVIFDIEGDILLVLRVGHRREIYK